MKRDESNRVYWFHARQDYYLIICRLFYRKGPPLRNNLYMAVQGPSTRPIVIFPAEMKLFASMALLSL